MKRLFHRLWALPAMLVAALVQAAPTVTYYYNDLAGSPVVATNGAGQEIWRESYQPYGARTRNEPGAAENKVWFTSRRQDAETGLVYMGARYYDPVVGRFVSTDPAGFDENNLHSFNRYAYANNNPYRYVDPDGRASLALAGAGAAGVLLAGWGYSTLTPEQQRKLLGTIGSMAEYTILGQAGKLLSGAIFDDADAKKEGSEKTSPKIEPSDVAGKSPEEIDRFAKGQGLIPKGPDPAGGQGSYIDPVTGKQRVLVHPEGKSGPHAHVNDPTGQRLDIGGRPTNPESPQAHLPLKLP